MSESEPIPFRPREADQRATSFSTGARGWDGPPLATFNRRELDAILAVYGRKVAAGEWRDYAIDMGRETAVFSVFRGSSEHPLYRIEKTPKLARKQGAYSVLAPAGLILKRGHDLMRVLDVLETRLRAVD